MSHPPKAYSQRNVNNKNRVSPGDIGIMWLACEKTTVFVRYEQDYNGLNIMALEFYNPAFKPWINSPYIHPAEHNIINQVMKGLNQKAAKLKLAINLLTYN